MFSSSSLFVCTAILCWDSHRSQYSFSNFTRCSPSNFFSFRSPRLIPLNENRSFESHPHGFICSNCSLANLIRSIRLNFDQCEQNSTKIRLEQFDGFSLSKSREEKRCRCWPSTKPIKSIQIWTKIEKPSGKSHSNVVRVNRINGSASLSVYLFFASLFFLVFLGGFVGMIFFCLQSRQRRAKK